MSSSGLGIGSSAPSAKLQVSGNSIITTQLTVGGSLGSSNLNINGSLGYQIRSVSSDATLNSSLSFVDTSSDNISVFLPSASSSNGHMFQIKKTSSLNRMTLSSGSPIEGQTGYSIMSGNYNAYRLQSDGTQWHVLSSLPTQISSSSNISPLIFDQFTALDNGDIGGQGSGGGWGINLWSSPDTDAFFSSSIGLTHASLSGYSRGGAVEVGAINTSDGSVRGTRYFSTSLDDTTTYYIGFLLKMSGSPHNCSLLLLTSGARQVNAGRWNSEGNWALSYYDGSWTHKSTGISTTTSTTFFVLKMALVSGTGDIASLYINPTDASDLSGAADATHTFTNDFLDANGISLLRTNNGANDGSGVYDEIRIDTEPSKMFTPL